MLEKGIDAVKKHPILIPFGVSITINTPLFMARLDPKRTVPPREYSNFTEE